MTWNSSATASSCWSTRPRSICWPGPRSTSSRIWSAPPSRCATRTRPRPAAAAAPSPSDPPRQLLRIATWNVNSVRSRIGQLTSWLRAGKPDIVLLQELKCVADGFPRLEIEDLGYNLVLVGQKTYNGVAILSRFPMTVEAESLAGGDGSDSQARYVEAVIEPGPRVVRALSVYVPNGNPAPGEKLAYKLASLDPLPEQPKAPHPHPHPLVI